jgi:hypothetical protein
MKIASDLAEAANIVQGFDSHRSTVVPDPLCSYKSPAISLIDQSEAGAIQPLISLIYPGSPLPLLCLNSTARSKLLML